MHDASELEGSTGVVSKLSFNRGAPEEVKSQEQTQWVKQIKADQSNTALSQR